MVNIPQNVILAAQKCQKAWKVPASISIAQWALESGWGAHDLGCFNYFGMKAPVDAKGVPTVPFVSVRTREVNAQGKDYYINAPFRKFTSPDQAFDLHGKLLATGSAYTKARATYPNADAFADALTGKYATDPKYGTLLKQIMKGRNLYQYDRV